MTRKTPSALVSFLFHNPGNVVTVIVRTDQNRHNSRQGGGAAVSSSRRAACRYGTPEDRVKLSGSKRVSAHMACVTVRNVDAYAYRRHVLASPVPDLRQAGIFLPGTIVM